MLAILKSKTILYVEDEPQIQKSVRTYLEHYFGRVIVADDGQMALEYYRRYHPDVLLLDINLPKRDGLEVAREIRREDDTTKIVMLTAHTEQEKLLVATELNLCKYLIKPVTPKHFKMMLQLLAEKMAKEATSREIISLTPTCYWESETQQLWHEGTPISLSLKERKLLQLLLEHRQQRVSYEDIMVALWEDAYEREISLNSVKNQVSSLRKKAPNLKIESIYGVGYVLY